MDAAAEPRTPDTEGRLLVERTKERLDLFYADVLGQLRGQPK